MWQVNFEVLFKFTNVVSLLEGYCYQHALHLLGEVIKEGYHFRKGLKGKLLLLTCIFSFTNCRVSATWSLSVSLLITKQLLRPMNFFLISVSWWKCSASFGGNRAWQDRRAYGTAWFRRPPPWRWKQGQGCTGHLEKELWQGPQPLTLYFMV